jgi:hypothetical protein
MSKMGFKCSWDKPERKRKVKEEMPTIVPGGKVATLIEMQMKISEQEEFIVSKAFSRLSVKDRREVVDLYRFLTATMALTTEAPPSAEVSAFGAYAAPDTSDMD